MTDAVSEYIDIPLEVLKHVQQHHSLEIIGIRTTTTSFIKALGILQDTHAALHMSPRRAVDGENGAAEILGVSKNGFNKRVKNLGLTNDEIRNPKATIVDLVKMSPVLQDLWSEIHDFYQTNVISAETD